MMAKASYLCLSGLFVLFATGCGGNDAPYAVVIHARSDDGESLPGLAVTLAGTALGRTDAHGDLSVGLRGKEGARVAVVVETPAGYRVKGALPELVLRRLRGIDGALLPVEATVALAPLVRQYAVAVRVGVPDLPVETFGTPQTITNSKGVALFLYRGTPGDELQVRIATASHPELRPQNPLTSFVLGDHPDAYVVKEKFAVYKAPVAKKKKPVFVGPHRL